MQRESPLGQSQRGLFGGPGAQSVWQEPWRERCTSGPLGRWLGTASRTLLLNGRLTSAELRRRPRNFFIGVVTVFIVVFVTSAVMNGVSKAGVIFLKLSEEQTGEMDALMTAGKVDTPGEIPFLDQSEAANLTHGNRDIAGVAPRWLLTASVRKKWPETPEENVSVATTLLIVDSRLEKKIPIGRGWPYRSLGEGEAHVKDSILRQIGAKANNGDHILVKLDVIQLLEDRGVLSEQNILTLFNRSGVGALNSSDAFTVISRGLGLSDDDQVEVNTTNLASAIGDTFGIDAQASNGSELQSVSVQEIRDGIGEAVFGGATPNSTLELNLTSWLLDQLSDLELDMDVIDSIGDPQGKYPAALGNIIMIDSQHLITTLFEQLCFSSQRRLVSNVFNTDLPTREDIVGADFDIHTRALLTYTLFSERLAMYTGGRDYMNRVLVDKSDALMRSLGLRYNATVTYPLALAMQGSFYLSLFIGQILQCAVIILVILGCILIYSLLLSNVEERTYEHGMLRALGLSKSALVNLLTMQAVTFAVPGTLVGIALSALLNLVYERLVSDFSGFAPDYGNMHILSIAIPIAIGCVVPLVSNIVPIQRALGRALRDALDIAHQSQSVTEVTMERLESVGLQLWQTLLALFMVCAGMMVYYLMPYSFIFDDLPFFFWLLLIILLGMLLGLCMVCSALQSPLEKVMLHGLLWGKDRVLRTLILKNLSMHRGRSSKTYIMFTISVASVIFGGVVFTLMAGAIQRNIEAFVGSDVQVWAQDFDTPLEREKIDEFLRQERASSGVVKEWAYVTFGHKQYEQFGSGKASNLLFFPTATQELRGVDKNFLETVYNEYFMLAGEDSGVDFRTTSYGIPDVVRSLYTSESEQDAFRPDKVYSGVPPTDTSLPDHVNYDTFDVNQKYAKALDCIVSAGAKDVLSATADTTLKFQLQYYDPRDDTSKEANYLAKPRALIAKLPGFPFVVSRYSFLLPLAPLLLSVDSYRMVVEENTFHLSGNRTAPPSPSHREETNKGGVHVVLNPESTVDEEAREKAEIRWEKLFIRMRGDVSKEQREDFINHLKSYLTRELQQVFDTQEWKDTTVVAINMLMMFFYLVSVINLGLNFFLLWVSFATNVKQNAWTFAVMRAVGFTVSQLIRAYIYEALATVLSAFLCGSLVGILIAVTLTLQFNMFVEMPFHFDFPWVFFFVLLFEAVGSAVSGSWVPARALREREIAQLLKSH